MLKEKPVAVHYSQSYQTMGYLVGDGMCGSFDMETMKYFAPDEREDAEEYMKEHRAEKDYVDIFQVIDMKERDAEFKLKDKHYERMEHCIGIEQDKVKDGLYKAYRNGSCYNECIPEWEDLVRNGYAKRWGEIGQMIFYGVTQKGFKAIACRWGIRIRYEIEIV
jgi:hypothetical protein